jgi:hypothetical protein
MVPFTAKQNFLQQPLEVAREPLQQHLELPLTGGVKEEPTTTIVVLWPLKTGTRCIIYSMN